MRMPLADVQSAIRFHIETFGEREVFKMGMSLKEFIDLILD